MHLIGFQILQEKKGRNGLTNAKTLARAATRSNIKPQFYQPGNSLALLSNFTDPRKAHTNPKTSF
jgi:hypothetical protein